MEMHLGWQPKSFSLSFEMCANGLFARFHIDYIKDLLDDEKFCQGCQFSFFCLISSSSSKLSQFDLFQPIFWFHSPNLNSFQAFSLFFLLSEKLFFFFKDHTATPSVWVSTNMVAILICLFISLLFSFLDHTATPSLWVGTNMGAILIYTLSVPEESKRGEISVAAEIGESRK